MDLGSPWGEKIEGPLGPSNLARLARTEPQVCPRAGTAEKHFFARPTHEARNEDAWTYLMWARAGCPTEPPGAFPGFRSSPRAVAARPIF